MHYICHELLLLLKFLRPFFSFQVFQFKKQRKVMKVVHAFLFLKFIWSKGSYSSIF